MASRAGELDEAINSLAAAEARQDVVRGDLAGLVALQEAIDGALAHGGVVGARGQAKDLVRLRLRTSNLLRDAAHEYETVTAGADALATAVEQSLFGEPSTTAVKAPVQVQGNLLSELTQMFAVASLAEVGPLTFDAEVFLKVIAETQDPSVSRSDRNRADRLLLKHRNARVENCTCRGARHARDAGEFAEWVASIGRICEPVTDYDRYLAAVIRALGAGKELKPVLRFTLQHAAFAQVTEYEQRRARGEAVHEGGNAEAEEDKRIQGLAQKDEAIQRFWGTALSPATEPATNRLDALEKLQVTDALRRCVCPPADTEVADARSDAYFAAVIRELVRTSLIGAAARVRFPEALAALREVSDQKILSDWSVESACAEEPIGS